MIIHFYLICQSAECLALWRQLQCPMRLYDYFLWQLICETNVSFSSSQRAMNAPNRHESFVLDDGEKGYVLLPQRCTWCWRSVQRVEVIEDTKIPNAATFKVIKQDHTLANMLRSCVVSYFVSLFPLTLNSANFSQHPLSYSPDTKYPIPLSLTLSSKYKLMDQ